MNIVKIKHICVHTGSVYTGSIYTGRVFHLKPYTLVDSASSVCGVAEQLLASKCFNSMLSQCSDVHLVKVKYCHDT